VLAGLGGGFGAGRVYERYNVALQELQTGGDGILPTGGLSFDDMKDKVVGPGGAVDRLRSVVGLGPAQPEAAAPASEPQAPGSETERS
jgi:hypothetical protein